VIGVRVIVELFAMAAHVRFLEEQRNMMIETITNQVITIPPWDEAGGRLVRSSKSNEVIMASYLLDYIGLAIGIGTGIWIEQPDLRVLAIATVSFAIASSIFIVFALMRADRAYSMTLGILTKLKNENRT
jgi:hypothetical protein